MFSGRACPTPPTLWGKGLGRNPYKVCYDENEKGKRKREEGGGAEGGLGVEEGSEGMYLCVAITSYTCNPDKSVSKGREQAI